MAVVADPLMLCDAWLSSFDERLRHDPQFHSLYLVANTPILEEGSTAPGRDFNIIHSQLVADISN